jgi:hypothetical protein
MLFNESSDFRRRIQSRKCHNNNTTTYADALSSSDGHIETRVYNLENLEKTTDLTSLFGGHHHKKKHAIFLQFETDFSIDTSAPNGGFSTQTTSTTESLRIGS